MNTNNKELHDDKTQLFSSDQNQTESKSNHRPFIRDAAMASAGVGVGVAGSYIADTQTSENTSSVPSENTTGTTVNDTASQSNNTTNPSVDQPVGDAVQEEVKPEDSPAPEEVVLTTANGANVAHVEDSLTFAEAFADARNQVGPGGVFTYNGQLYNTYYKEEWNNLTSEQRNEYYASISLDSAPKMENNQPEPPVAANDENNYYIAEEQLSEDEVYVLGVGAATIEGQEVYVAHLSAGGEDVILLDVDKDGTFDLAVADSNSDGTITNNEVHDISQGQLTVDQMQEALNSIPGVFAEDPTIPDYTNDADISHFA